MHFNQFPLLVFATGTGLCNGSLLRRASESSSTPINSTTLQPFISSPTSLGHQSKVTSPPGTKLAQLAGMISILPECNGFVLSASSAVSSSLASNASAQLVYLSTSAAASISIAQASISAADASASRAISQVQSSASSALASCNAEITNIQGSVSSQYASVTASLISAAVLATNVAQAAALAMGAAATESAWAISSQLADAKTAVQFSKATTLPMTVAVVLIIGTSFASSVVSVLIYRFFSRKKMREREMETEREKERELERQMANERREGQNMKGGGFYGGRMEKNTQSYRDPHPGISYSYPPIGRSPASTYPRRSRYTFRYATSDSEQEIINRDYIEGNYERGDEDNYSSHDIIDIEKEIAEMDYQMKMAEAELERRDRERPIRMSEDSLSRSSKSISVLFTPRDVFSAARTGEQRRSASARSIMNMSLGIGERLRSMVMPSYRQSESPSSSQPQSQSQSPLEPSVSSKDKRNSSRDIGDRDLEEGEEIIFTLDERPPPLPRSRPTHAYKNSDASIMTLSPSVYDGGSGNGKKGKGKGGDGDRDRDRGEMARRREKKETDEEKEKVTPPFRISIGKAF
ncbi:hypothetical protein EYC80_006712 [Monilinia laxa]|uniref:Uncharacterized protein n=1 Tax=Monilinia laxa TaxID=61186 RepID=A0A5N6JZ05_MONLA|nr:hypothetical protein EYC80_006712 [Monilinia laxa]